MINIVGFKTKKSLKEAVGRRVSVNDPSIVQEYTGTGSYCCVGPGLYDRKWYAVVTIEDGILKSVK